MQISCSDKLDNQKLIQENKGPKTIEDVKCQSNYSALVINQEGIVIFEDNADYIVFPASLTKLMTAYIVFGQLKKQNLTLEQLIEISPRASEISNINKITTLNLESKDIISVEDALKGMVVKSLNGAAIALSEVVSGSEWNFVVLMNKKAKEMGMKFTNFRNPSGFHEFGQFTTNYDLLKLVKAIIIDFPEYYNIFAIRDLKINDKEFISHNRVLLSREDVDGMKTGFTSASGYNIISTSKTEGGRIISILTSCETWQKRDEFTLYLLDINKK